MMTSFARPSVTCFFSPELLWSYLVVLVDVAILAQSPSIELLMRTEPWLFCPAKLQVAVFAEPFRIVLPVAMLTRTDFLSTLTQTLHLLPVNSVWLLLGLLSLDLRHLNVLLFDLLAHELHVELQILGQEQLVVLGQQLGDVRLVVGGGGLGERGLLGGGLFGWGLGDGGELAGGGFGLGGGGLGVGGLFGQAQESWWGEAAPEERAAGAVLVADVEIEDWVTRIALQFKLEDRKFRKFI